MDIFTIGIWIGTLIFLGVSFAKIRERQIKHLKWHLIWEKEWL